MQFHFANMIKNYLKRGLTMLVLCLPVCSPVQKNADTAFLIIQRGKVMS